LPDTNGRGQISATADTINGGLLLNYYTVDGTTFPFIETDGGQVATGVFVQQNPPQQRVRQLYIPTCSSRGLCSARDRRRPNNRANNPGAASQPRPFFCPLKLKAFRVS